MKPARSYRQQLDLLKQRGLDVPDEGFAIHCLEHHNYYRLSYARHEIGPYIPGLNFSDFCLHQYGDSNDRTFDILGQPSQGY